MFNIGFGEIMLVLVVAFVVVGPDDLPRVARWLGRNLRKLKVLIRDLKKETGWDEIEREVKDVQRDVKQTVRQMDVTADLKDAAKSVKTELDSAVKDTKKDLRAIEKDMKSDIAAMDAELKDAAKPDKPQ